VEKSIPLIPSLQVAALVQGCAIRPMALDGYQAEADEAAQEAHRTRLREVGTSKQLKDLPNSVLIARIILPKRQVSSAGCEEIPQQAL
jgi:hypothetical protein